MISKEYPRVVNIVIAEDRITFTFWQIIVLLFMRSVIVCTKTYTTKNAGEKLATTAGCGARK